MNDLTSETTNTASEEQWMLNGRAMWTLQVVGTLGVVPAFALFLLWAALFDRMSVIDHAFRGAPFGFLLLVPLLILHELCHGLAFHVVGARPRYGFKALSGVPVLFATAPGCWMTRNAYTVVGFAPTVLVNALGLTLMALLPFLRYPLVTAMSLHLAGCSGDWWIMSKVLRLPRAARIEDLESGFRYRVETTHG